jgi:hypothetical protein
MCVTVCRPSQKSHIGNPAASIWSVLSRRNSMAVHGARRFRVDPLVGIDLLG